MSVMGEDRSVYLGEDVLTARTMTGRARMDLLLGLAALRTE
jgi:hypothetical protein